MPINEEINCTNCRAEGFYPHCQKCQLNRKTEQTLFWFRFSMMCLWLALISAFLRGKL